MSVLGAVLPLGEGPGRVEDTEKLVRKVLDDRLKKFNAKLKEHDYEDAVAFLCSQAWEISCRYDEKKDRNPNLAAYVAHIVSLRVTDWYRHRFGDTRHGASPIVLSLDAPATLGDGDIDDSEAGRSQLVETLAASSGNPADDCSTDLVRLLHGDDRGGARAHDPVGEPSARGAASGDREGQRSLNRDERSPAGKKNGRIPGIYSTSPPICGTCVTTFAEMFEQLEQAKPLQTRATPEEVIVRARGRARAVRVKGEWICPRCTTIDDPTIRQAVFDKAYPESRKARRAAERAAAKNTRRNK